MKTLQRTREALATYGNYYKNFNSPRTHLHYLRDLI